VYNYVIQWIAHLIQRPQEKSTHLIFYGEEGTGKTTLIEILEILLGKKKVLQTTHPSRDVWGQFNSIMMYAQLVNLNELSKQETINAEGFLKGLITDSTMQINRKGIDVITIESFHRFISTFNPTDKEIIRTHQKDRRNLFVVCHNVRDAEYFRQLRVFMNDVNVMKTVYEYFKGLPGADQFRSLKLPTTEYQDNMRQLAKSPIQCWLEDFCLVEHLDERTNQRKMEFTNEQLFAEFKHYCDTNGFRYECNSNQFSVRLANMKVKGIENARFGKSCSRGKRFNFGEVLYFLGGGQ
jgi:phage/plasmid-associated DNA primase